MKKYLLISLIVVSYVFPRDVSPVITIRYNNLSDAVTVNDAIGLKFDLGNSRYTGFDTDGDDHRVYVGWSFGKIGIGHDKADKMQFTVGASYEVIDNIGLDLDYVLGDDSNDLRLGININF